MTKPRNLFLFLVILPLFIYIRTLPPTITWCNDGVDGGDLATAVAVGGVPHPPGYPTYLILGETFKLLPLGDVAYRLNLLSAICAALTVAIGGLITYQTLFSATRHQEQTKIDLDRMKRFIWLCSASAALTLAFSAPFWSQAVITEVYALNMFFVVILIYGALKVQPANQGWLIPLLAGILGLSLGNHPSILLLGPMLIWISGTSFQSSARGNRWHWQLIAATLVAFCLGLSVYIIIPIRAAAYPPINWGMAVTWPDFWWLVSAEPYRQFLFSLPGEFIPTRVGAELHLLVQAFVGWGVIVGLLGFHKLVHLNGSLAYSSQVTFFLFSIYAIGYNTTDSSVYLLPAMLIFSVWMGWGLYVVANAVHQFIGSKFRSGWLISWAIILLPLISLLSNFSDQDISQDNEAYAYAQQSLQMVAPGAVIVTDNDPHTFALWYGRYALSWRPDCH